MKKCKKSNYLLFKNADEFWENVRNENYFVVLKINENRTHMINSDNYFIAFEEIKNFKQLENKIKNKLVVFDNVNSIVIYNITDKEWYI